MPLSRPYVLRPKRGLGDTDSCTNTINIGKITVNIEGKMSLEDRLFFASPHSAKPKYD